MSDTQEPASSLAQLLPTAFSRWLATSLLPLPIAASAGASQLMEVFDLHPDDPVKRILLAAVGLGTALIIALTLVVELCRVLAQFKQPRFIFYGPASATRNKLPGVLTIAAALAGMALAWQVGPHNSSPPLRADATQIAKETPTKMIRYCEMPIIAMGYRAEDQRLKIQFSQGKTYDFCEVPNEVFTEFSLAESKGGYYNANIRSRYRCPGY